MTQPSLLTEIERFQCSHSNHLGRMLFVDNDPGPETRWAQAFEQLAAERRECICRAQQWIDWLENPLGSNGDARGIIQDWLRASSAEPGDPWCAAFVSAMLALETLPEAIDVDIAGALRLGAAFPSTQQPICGDLFFYPTGGGKGHVGFVLGTAPAEIMTLEGNSNNGVRVWRRSRGQGLLFARTPFVATVGVLGAPGVVPSVPFCNTTATR